MDLHMIDDWVPARTRQDLTGLAASDALVAGGTWLFSQPQPTTTRLIDLSTMGWPDLTIDDDGLEIAATCTIEKLITGDYPAAWRAAPLFGQCARALLASSKIWRTATVGGNICLGFPAGAMISLCAALAGQAVIWRADGSEEYCGISDFVTDVGVTALQPGDVLRAIRLPVAALTEPTALRKVAYAPLGRSGAIVIARGRSDGAAGLTVTVSAGTRRPIVIDAPDAPTALSAVAAIAPHEYHDDAHGKADWRRAVTGHLAAEVVAELAS
ncbi:FAD-binding molybdopterin dehydrogenase [Gordonia sp. TBRC 11910]|uniref:FAD-binding molybdopterin dehydrogenase n=1 Tax=Gordonia asplenii TaxID=2725283 RepID=A0A848L3C2_9ACTN|nr:FAD binding domain-containing protein [Gordonia asplenii]NMO05017.1 FAD-binding molybdopterin dehydrogenase [Gordonia asplenii]